MCLKRLLLVFLTTMFMGCAAASQLIQIPKFSAAWQIDPGSGNVPSVKEVSQAMIVYYVHWERTFGDRNKKVKKALNGLMIEWSTKRRLVKANGWTTDGRRIKRGYINGATLAPGYIWVRVRGDGSVSSSSLIHEMVHVSLWAIDPWERGDADHEGNKYSGWTRKHTEFIKKVNYALKEIGL
jgi:hypothetical protein